MRARPTSSLRLCPLLLQLHPHPCNQFLVNVAAVTAVQLQEQRAADHQGTTLAAPAPVSPSSAPPAPGEASDPAGRQPQHGLPLPQCRPLFPIFLPSPSPSKGRSRVMSLARRPSLPSFGSLNIDGHPPERRSLSFCEVMLLRLPLNILLAHMPIVLQLSFPQMGAQTRSTTWMSALSDQLSSRDKTDAPWLCPQLVTCLKCPKMEEKNSIS